MLPIINTSMATTNMTMAARRGHRRKAFQEPYESRVARERFQLPPGKNYTEEIFARSRALSERMKVPVQQRGGLPSLRQPWHTPPVSLSTNQFGGPR